MRGDAGPGARPRPFTSAFRQSSLSPREPHEHKVTVLPGEEAGSFLASRIRANSPKEVDAQQKHTDETQGPNAWRRVTPPFYFAFTTHSLLTL